MNTHFKHNTARSDSKLVGELPDRTLVIGNLGRWKSEGRITTALSDFKFLDLQALTSEALVEFAPDIILSPLVGDDFDVIDVADKLTECGFRGRYRVVSEGFPNSEMIRREVSSHAPKIDFDLLLLSENPTEKALRDVSDRPQTAPHSVDNVKRTARGR